MCIRPKGRTQCIFPRSQHTCLYIYIDQKLNLYQVVFGQQNGCRWPFLMSKTHFRWHFWPFQISTKLFLQFFYKMAAGAHFGYPKFTFDTQL